VKVAASRMSWSPHLWLGVGQFQLAYAVHLWLYSCILDFGGAQLIESKYISVCITFVPFEGETCSDVGERNKENFLGIDR